MLSASQYQSYPDGIAVSGSTDNNGYMNNLPRNIARRMRAKDWTQRDLAKHSGVSQVTIHKLISGKSQRSRYLEDIAKALDCTVEDLLSGNGLDTTKEALNPSAAVVTSHLSVNESTTGYGQVPVGIVELWGSDTPLGDDEVELPLFREVELAAGSGRTHVQENRGAKLRFARSTLARKGIDPSHAGCCFVSGDSMENVLPDGSTVAVDTSQKVITDGKMYAIDHGGLLRVKYLHRLPGGRIKVSSENKAYGDEFIAPEEMEDFRIIGRVFWYAVLL